MDFDMALRCLKTVKRMGFREQELGLPIPDAAPCAAAVPHEDNFSGFVESEDDSSYRELMLSDFPSTSKGAFAFGCVMHGLGKALGDYSEDSEKNGSALRFGMKNRNGHDEWLDALASGKNTDSVLDSLPAKAKHEREIERAFAVHSDGEDVKVYMKFGKGWKKAFAVPYTENTWPVKEDEFLAAYALGTGIYGGREFSPSYSSALYAATRKGEYGWISEEFGIGNLMGSASELHNSLAEPGFGQFLAFAYLLSKGQVARIRERTVRAPEFYFNVPYALVKAGVERNRGNMQESLFLLRCVSDLSLLTLRFSPLGGRMLALAKYFDGMENMANRRFALSGSVVKMLRDIGMGTKKGGPLALEKKDFSTRGGKTYMTFGALLWAMKAAAIRGAKWEGPEFWASLRSQNAKVFVMSYGEEDALDLLEEETEVTRGSDIVKVEEFFSKLVVKRAMALESGRAKEIKAHLARIIEVADKRSADEKALLAENGSCGEAVYEAAARGKRAALALVSSKRFY
ncbi:MAG: hypothetical protein WC488_02265 [Candidatus Micrarchaeia archaeon]